MSNTLKLAIIALALSACDPIKAVHQAWVPKKHHGTTNFLTIRDILAVGPSKRPNVSPVESSPAQYSTPIVQESSPSLSAVPGSLAYTLYAASAAEKTPVEILYAVKRNETGSTTGKGTNLGRCNAKEQLEIMCHHNPKDCHHLAALKAMAGIHGWNLSEVPGSCGEATMAVDAKEHGGAIGEMQTLPGYYFTGKYGRKDPFNPFWATHHASATLKQYHDESKSSDPQQRWQWAIRRYRGMPTGGVSKGYYDMAVEKWKTAATWRNAGMLAQCIDQPSSRECACIADPLGKRCGRTLVAKN